MSNTVHIVLVPEARGSAETALIKRGITPREHFDGPIFSEVPEGGFHVTTAGVHVEVEEDTTYFYPMHQIARLKITKSKE